MYAARFRLADCIQFIGLDGLSHSSWDGMRRGGGQALAITFKVGSDICWVVLKVSGWYCMGESDGVIAFSSLSLFNSPEFIGRDELAVTS